VRGRKGMRCVSCSHTIVRCLSGMVQGRHQVLPVRSVLHTRTYSLMWVPPVLATAVSQVQHEGLSATGYTEAA